MRTCMRVCIILILLTSAPLALFAGDSVETVNLTFHLRDDVRACRYQINGDQDGQWTLVDINDPSIEWVIGNKYQDRVFYQYTLDGKTWSSNFELYFNPDTNKWEHMYTSLAEPISDQTQRQYTLISVGGQYLLPISEIPQSMFENGYGGSLRIEQTAGELFYYGEASYIYGDSPSALIDTIHTGMAGIGVRYQIEAGIFSLSSEIGAGVHIGAPIHSEHGYMWCFDGYGTAGASISRNINEDQDVFLRGNAILLSSFDQFSIETAVTAGTNFRL